LPRPGVVLALLVDDPRVDGRRISPAWPLLSLGAGVLFSSTVDTALLHGALEAVFRSNRAGQSVHVTAWSIKRWAIGCGRKMPGYGPDPLYSLGEQFVAASTSRRFMTCCLMRSIGRRSSHISVMLFDSQEGCLRIAASWHGCRSGAMIRLSRASDAGWVFGRKAVLLNKDQAHPSSRPCCDNRTSFRHFFSPEDPRADWRTQYQPKKTDERFPRRITRC
jgi:hypothetical protein